MKVCKDCGNILEDKKLYCNRCGCDVTYEGFEEEKRKGLNIYYLYDESRKVKSNPPAKINKNISSENTRPIITNKSNQTDSRLVCIQGHYVTISREYSCYTPQQQHIRFIVDTQNRQVAVLYNGADGIIIPFSKLRDCKIFVDREKAKSGTRAYVGAQLFGGIGALVGAATAKDKIYSYKVVLYTKDISNPKHEITLIGEKIKATDECYSKASEFASNVKSTIIAIVSGNR